MTTQALVHPFSSIMPGPYSYAGYRDASTLNDLLDQKDSMFSRFEEGACIGSCDHCSTAISYAVLVRGANGVFKVGETCARLADEKVGALAKKAGNERRKKAKASKLDSDFTICIKWMNQSSYELPHPKGWEGKTLYDYLSWYLSNAGKAKFVQTCKRFIPKG
jgi:hypothetical protein